MQFTEWADSMKIAFIQYYRIDFTPLLFKPQIWCNLFQCFAVEVFQVFEVGS